MTTVPGGHEIRIFRDHTALMEAAAEDVAQCFVACRTGGRVALAGGRTPVTLYERLSAPTSPIKVDVSRIRFTLTDERAVPPDHEDSNYGLAYRTFFEPLKVPVENVLRFHGEKPIERATAKAHRELLVWAQRVPLFDLVILGLGADGHVASLFPAPEWPDFGARLVASTVDPHGRPRITLTPEALRSSRRTMFLVSGASKAPAVRDTLTADAPSPSRPARMVGGGKAPVVWFLDRAAASLLPDSLRQESGAESRETTTF